MNQLRLTIDLVDEALPKGEVYFEVFFCYGCQTCWRLNEKDEVVQMPHVLGYKVIPKERISPE